MSRLLPGERVLWEGRPDWRAVARDVVRVGWLAAYFGVVMIWNAASNRLDGLGPVETLRAGVPVFVAAVVMLAGCVGFAYAIARTTRYTLTTERCILRYGVALTATLSLPLRRMAAVSVAAREGGAGDILLKLKPGASRVRYLKIWPHARPWRFKVAEPMLRGVPDAITVAALLSHAVAQVSPGVLHALPEKVRATLPGAILSPAGD